MWFKRKPFTSSQETVLLQAISTAEEQTSGEIRLHIDAKCPIDPIEKAKQVFVKLKMHETAERNGILFYVNLKQKRFAIWGDEGINNKVPANFWDEIKNTCIDHFKKDQIVEGLEKSILMCGNQLKTHFPHKANDKNELSNDISF
jgi:uncharacterized membrane protein